MIVEGNLVVVEWRMGLPKHIHLSSVEVGLFREAMNTKYSQLTMRWTNENTRTSLHLASLSKDFV